MSHREVEEQIIREMEVAAQNQGADKVRRWPSAGSVHTVDMLFCLQVGESCSWSAPCVQFSLCTNRALLHGIQEIA